MYLVVQLEMNILVLLYGKATRPPIVDVYAWKTMLAFNIFIFLFNSIYTIQHTIFFRIGTESRCLFGSSPTMHRKLCLIPLLI